MTLAVVWTAEAQADLTEAFAWYEARRVGLGQRFVRALDAAVAEIADNPLQFPTRYRTLRRAGVRRFPYGVFFHVESDRVVVVACFHARRDPHLWHARE
jgi:toxin ParE1/3/4